MSDNIEFGEAETPRTGVVEPDQQEQSPEQLDELVEKAIEINRDLLHPGENEEEVVVEEAQQEEIPQEPEQEIEENEEEGDGYEYVKFDPPTQKRFNRMYGQVKAQDVKLAKQEKLFTDMQEHFAKVSKKLQTYEDAETVKNNEAQINRIKQEIAEASSDGDSTRVAELTYDLVKQETANQNKPVVEEPVAPQSSVTSEEQAYAANWTGEMADNGDFVRPWAQDGHPLKPFMIKMVETVASHPDHTNDTIEDIFEKVDAIMFAQTGKNINNNVNTNSEPTVATVSNSNASYRPTNNKNSVSRLTVDEKAVAEMLMPEMKPAEAHKAYAANK